MSDSHTATARAVPFEFDREFTKGAVVAPRRERKKTRWTEQEVEAIRAEAHAAGMAEGRASAEAEATRQMAEQMALLAAGVSTLTQALAAERMSLRDEAAEIALALARKLAPALMETAPRREIEAMVADALALLRDEPRVVVGVAPGMESDLQARLAEIAAEQGFEGALVVRAEADIAPGDAHIEWARGQILRDTPALEARIEEIVRSYLAAPCDDEPVQTDIFSLLGTDA